TAAVASHESEGRFRGRATRRCCRRRTILNTSSLSRTPHHQGQSPTPRRCRPRTPGTGGARLSTLWRISATIPLTSMPQTVVLRRCALCFSSKLPRSGHTPAKSALPRESR
ncbi:unnamed protein product, partial [Ectocarpus sp. 12 AP-2014]